MTPRRLVLKIKFAGVAGSGVFLFWQNQFEEYGDEGHRQQSGGHQDLHRWRQVLQRLGDLLQAKADRPT
ncbi:MAG: hypothetical protein ACTSSQ_08185 [Alphaproteobacteria bacterium]